MADTLSSYSNLPLGLNMYHLQVELSAVPNFPIYGCKVKLFADDTSLFPLFVILNKQLWI